MSPEINQLITHVSPKQKKDLLGIYKDYLYFGRGLEYILNQQSPIGIVSMFVERVGWVKDMEMPWWITFVTPEEQKDYIKFAGGHTEDAKQYGYMSLYHTQTGQDVSYPKISLYPETYDYVNIDMELPSPVERYAIAYPSGQKLKDVSFLIDGIFKVNYIGEKFSDLPVIEAFYNDVMQKEFRVMLSLAENYYRKQCEIENSPAPLDCMRGVMTKIVVAESISAHENKILDLLGSYADKCLDILRTIYSDKNAKITTKEIWARAEKDGLIASAENMHHYLNIRHLIRHQWDTLDNTNKVFFDSKVLNEQYRREYLNSYHMIFDRTLVERIKEYQKIAAQLQTTLRVFYDNFLPREKEESNSKFVQRIKLWQRENPDKKPIICGNYLLNSPKHKSLVSNLNKVTPQAVVIDDFNSQVFQTSEALEHDYFTRTFYLSIYNRLVGDFVRYALSNGLRIKPQDMWKHLSKVYLSEDGSKRWRQYHDLRNNLSHDHFDEKLRDELNQTLTNSSFQEDYNNLLKFMSEHSAKFVHVKDDIHTATQKDGSVVYVDLGNNLVLAHYDKDGHDLLKSETMPQKKATEVNLSYDGEDVVKCSFDNGIEVDLNRKKICFADKSCIYFDAQNYNVFQFANGKRIFTDKTFMVTKYLEGNRKCHLQRNELLMVSSKHKIATNSKNRLSESSIRGDDNEKSVTRFICVQDGTLVVLPDGTKLKTSKDQFVLSHNKIQLTKETAEDFLNSYKIKQIILPYKPPFER